MEERADLDREKKCKECIESFGEIVYPVIYNAEVAKLLSREFMGWNIDNVYWLSPTWLRHAAASVVTLKSNECIEKDLANLLYDSLTKVTADVENLFKEMGGFGKLLGGEEILKIKKGSEKIYNELNSVRQLVHMLPEKIAKFCTEKKS